MLLTDGITTEGKPISEVAHYARRKGIPLYILGVGDERPPRDLRLSDLLVDDAVFLGDVVNFDFKLSGSGFGSRTGHGLAASRQGSEEVLAQQTLTVAGDATSHTVRLSYRPMQEGEYEFVVGCRSAAERIEHARTTGCCSGCRCATRRFACCTCRSIRVLEFRFLKTLLERGLKRAGGGKAIELTTVLQEADLEYVELDEIGPAGISGQS